MKVIGAGFGRTGTVSLKQGLEQLGFGPCYHMDEVIKHPRRIEIWQAAADGYFIDFKLVFNKYQSTVDWPGAAFYKELMQVFPDAKVILTVRDPEHWYDSTYQSIYQMDKQLPFWIKWLLPPLERYLVMARSIVWNGVFNGRFSDRDYAISIFNDHIEQVKNVVPSEKLLIFNVKDGWDPLCQFLGVPIPTNSSFPHTNNREKVQRNIRRTRLLVWSLPVVYLFAGILLFLLFRYIFFRDQ